MPETGFRPEPREGRRRREQLFGTAGAGLRLVRVQPLLLLILATFFFVGASTEAFDRLWEAHFLRDVGLPRLGSLEAIYWFGILNLGGLALGLLTTTLLAPRLRTAGHAALARILVALTALQLIGLGAFALAGSLALAIAARYLYTVGRSLAGPVQGTWLNQNIPDSRVRATVLSITEQSDAVGQVAGGPAIGGVGSALGLRAALVLGAALLAPALGLYGRALRHDGYEPELEELPEALEARA
jgi:predicted MFS family arabinose efflux permease